MRSVGPEVCFSQPETFRRRAPGARAFAFSPSSRAPMNRPRVLYVMGSLAVNDLGERVVVVTAEQVDARDVVERGSGVYQPLLAAPSAS